MCLIIAGSAHKIRHALLHTPGMLLDIFKSNPDGIGVMYATKSKLKIVKRLPKSLDEAQAFVERMPNDERQLAIHFRWTTHGDTNLENCHPYVVVEGEVALMHNGVLSSGNAKDKTKSDTWWFIKDYLHDSVQMAPGLVFEPGYIALVKDFIGNSNRFVFIGKDGRMTIVNKKEGVEHNDLWFSNTYAWNPSVYIDGYKSGWNGTTYYQPTRSRNYGYGNGYAGYGEYDDMYEWPNGGGHWSNHTGGAQSGNTKSDGVVHNLPALPPPASPAASPAVVIGGRESTTYTQEDAKEDAEWEKTVRRSHLEWQRDVRAHLAAQSDPPEEGTPQGEDQGNARAQTDDEVTILRPFARGDFIEALADADVNTFERWLTKFPQVTIETLFHLYRAAATKWTGPESLAAYERYLYTACMDGDKATLIAECRRSDGAATNVAEVICYYLNWLAWPTIVPAPSEQAAALDRANKREQQGAPEPGPDNSVYVG